MNNGARAIEKTLQLLAYFPDAPLVINRRGTSVEIVPKGEETFAITIYDEGEEAMVAAERWHTHYEDPDQVAWGVFWLLTPFYRVVHEYKGGLLVAVWLERYEEEGWVGFEPVFYLNPDDPPSWELKGDEQFGRRYLQQFIIPPPQPYDEICPGAALDEEGLPPDAVPGKRLVMDSKSVALTLIEE